MERKKTAGVGWPFASKAFGPEALTLLRRLAAVCVLLLCSAAAAAGQQKYGLFIGVNEYRDGVKPLRGCVNDAKKLQKTTVRHYGFRPENTLVLADAEATRDNILGSALKFQARAGAGDLFVFTFSGHGTLFPDAYSEEHDETQEISMEGLYPRGKYDSAICPIDLRSNTSGKPWRNLILDDELFAIFSGFTKKGATVIFVSDSCHSGSIGRDLSPGVNTKFVTTEEALGVSLDELPRPAVSRSIGPRDMQGRLLTLASSRDDETSLDHMDRETGEPAGLFTNILLRVIEEARAKNQPVTYMTVKDVVGQRVARLAAQMNSAQHPQVDNRFYNGDLNAPLFNAQPSAPPPAGTTTPARGLRVVVRVTDAAGGPLAGSAFVILRPGAGSAQGPIRREDALALGRTNARGIFDTGGGDGAGSVQASLISPGRYVVKVVKEGYKTFLGEVEIMEGGQPGFAILSFRLAKE